MILAMRNLHANAEDRPKTGKQPNKRSNWNENLVYIKKEKRLKALPGDGSLP